MRPAHPIGPSGLPAFSVTYAYPATRDHDHARLVHRVRVALNQMTHCSDLLRNRHGGEANDAGMRQTAHKHQLAEILVLRDEYPLLRERQGEQLIVRGAGRCLQS